jgi:hypothetical protein
MTIEEQAQRLQDGLRQLERTTRQPWATADDRQAVLHTMKTRLAEAERTLNLPATPDTSRARSRLIIWTTLVRDAVDTLDAEARAGQ